MTQNARLIAAASDPRAARAAPILQTITFVSPG